MTKEWTEENILLRDVLMVPRLRQSHHKKIERMTPIILSYRGKQTFFQSYRFEKTKCKNISCNPRKPGS